MNLRKLNDIVNILLGLTFLSILAFNMFAGAHLDNTGFINDYIHTHTLHLTDDSGIAGSIQLHPGTEPDAVPDSDLMWLDSTGDLLLLESNVNPSTKVSNLVSDGVAIFGQWSSDVDQTPLDTDPLVITYNTVGTVNGLTHSLVTDPGEITVPTAGVYFVSARPHVGKTSGGVKIEFNMFLQVDRGIGFVDETNSNVKFTTKDSDVNGVLNSAFTIILEAGDKIRMLQRVSNSSMGLGIKHTDAQVGPPTVPETPAIVLTIFRTGRIS